MHHFFLLQGKQGSMKVLKTSHGRRAGCIWGQSEHVSLWAVRVPSARCGCDVPAGMGTLALLFRHNIQEDVTNP